MISTYYHHPSGLPSLKGDFRTITDVLDMYALFTFEPLKNLSLGISIMIREFRFTCIASAFSGIGRKTSLLKAFNPLLTPIHFSRGSRPVSVYFAKEKRSADLNEISANIGFRNMLKGKDFDQLVSMFPLLAGSVLRRMRKRVPRRLTNVDTNHPSFSICQTVNIWITC